MAVSRIAAVVPSLGASAHLIPSLQALRGQSTAAEVEVVLVWQGGGAELPEAARVADRVVRTGRRLGFAAATNLGWSTALETGAPDFLAAVNDDVVVAGGWLDALLEALVSTPEAVAAQGANLVLDPPGGGEVDGCGLGWNRWWQALQLGRGGPPPPTADPPREVFGVSATAALYRREALAAASRGLGGGPFDARLGSYYEDVDLACRLRATGGSALLVPRARARHAGSTTGGRMALRRWMWIYGNRYLVLARLLGSRFGAELPRILLRDVADLAGALAGARGRRLLGILGGWARAVRHLGAYVRRGAPAVPMTELRRFQVS